MAKHKHIIIAEDGQARPFTSTQSGGGSFRVPPRDDRVGHARNLTDSITRAGQELQAQEPVREVKDIGLEVVGQTKALQLEKLERLRNGLGIELRNVHEREGQQYATVYVPESKLASFVKLFEDYATENTKKKNRPKNEPLVAGIDQIRTPVLRSFWTDDEALFPDDDAIPIWWEVWLQTRINDQADAAMQAFVEAVGQSDLRVGENVLKFPERLVFHVHGNVKQWNQAYVPLLDRLAELRKAKEIATEFFRLDSQTQRQLAEDLATRIDPPGLDAPAVCLLDFGVQRNQPLLLPFFRDEDVQALLGRWDAVDRVSAHGTEMAGLAMFGDELAALLAGRATPFTPHRLESVRILNTQEPHPEDTWGWVTQTGVAFAEQRAPDRSRVILLAVTADDRGRDHGYPTSWSAAVDQSAAGQLDDQHRLIVVSAGNVRTVQTDANYRYPDDNIKVHRVEDPAQSWNAVTVGANTELIQIRDQQATGCTPLAKQGELCPSSRTSTGWESHDWPLKPDIVMEGGNYAKTADGRVEGIDDLTILTTAMDATGKLLTWTADTSAASAQVARMAALLYSDYPDLWPETIRGLLVHSAKWTEAMAAQVPGDQQRDRHKRLRVFGYGRPDLDSARFTLNNRVALVHQGMIQPFRLEGSEVKTNEFRLHSLPWPRESLDALQGALVRLRVTLSYFIEPSPGRRGWKRKFRYQSHGLRFKLRGPTETDQQFRERVSKREWDEEAETNPSTSDPISWSLGSNLQTRGSVHSDWWETTGSELAACGDLAIHPVTGWWRERKHLGCVEKTARYALIVTIETQDETTDLYTPIVNQIATPVEVET